MKVHIHRPATDDDDADLGDFFAEGFGLRQWIVLAAAALFLLALFLPADEGDSGWWVGVTWQAKAAAAAASKWVRVLAAAPWYANLLLAVGFWHAAQGRFRTAGLWSVGAAALALVICWRDPVRWGTSPAYLAWVGSMATLSAALCFPQAPPAKASVVRDDPPRY